MESAKRRIANTAAHLAGNSTNELYPSELYSNDLNNILFDHLEYRHQVFDFLKDPFFAPRYELGIAGKYFNYVNITAGNHINQLLLTVNFI